MNPPRFRFGAELCAALIAVLITGCSGSSGSSPKGDGPQDSAVQVDEGLESALRACHAFFKATAAGVPRLLKDFPDGMNFALDDAQGAMEANPKYVLLYDAVKDFKQEFEGSINFATTPPDTSGTSRAMDELTRQCQRLPGL